MRLIAHRGNLNGPNPLVENDPQRITYCIDEGYDVDTFCHVWWDKDISEYDVSDWVGEQCIASGNPVEIIKSL